MPISHSYKHEAVLGGIVFMLGSVISHAVSAGFSP